MRNRESGVFWVKGKQSLSDHDRIGVYGRVQYGLDTGSGSSWSQIGVGAKNPDGSFDLDLSLWPTNLTQVRIGPLPTD